VKLFAEIGRPRASAQGDFMRKRRDCAAFFHKAVLKAASAFFSRGVVRLVGDSGDQSVA
jgi:hypothetical protein